MQFLNEELQNQLKGLFSDAQKNITLMLFTQEGECNTCAETRQLLEETVALSDKFHLVIKDLVKDAAEAKKYQMTLAPSFLILDENQHDLGVRFNGIPAGHEFNSFISALLEMSGHPIDYPKEVLDRIEKLSKNVNIKVFVTLSCPHCPGAVQNAHRLAMLNKNIVGEMIEAQTFYELSTKYNVSGVPKIVINDTIELVGNQPIEAFLDSIENL